ncbi:MAG: hypothetical protein SGILL_010856, partial [Bacillariaceae sp.]
KTIPKPNLFVGGTPNKVSRVKADLPQFAKQIVMQSNNATAAIEMFRTRYHIELDRVVLQLLEDDEFQHFKRDWQVILDASGNWYHIDADRGQLIGKGSKKSKLYKENVECGMRRVLYYLTRAAAEEAASGGTMLHADDDDDWKARLQDDVLFERKDDETCDENGMPIVWSTTRLVEDLDPELLVEAHPDAVIQFLQQHSSDGTENNDVTKKKVAAIAMVAAKKEGGLWPDIDWSQGPATMCGERRCNCGGKKCFYSSASNATVGYLVTRGQRNFDAVDLAYRKELDLVERYGVPALSLGPPTIIPLSSSVFDEVLAEYGSSKKKDSTPIFVQKVVKMPKPSFLIHRIDPDDIKRRIPAFSQVIAESNPGGLESFKQQYQWELERLKAIVHDPEHFLLLKDFQQILAPSGHFYYFDLDRARMKGKDWLDQGEMVASMEKILFWLTKADGDYSGLDQVQLFRKSACGMSCMQDLEERLRNEAPSQPMLSP